MKKYNLILFDVDGTLLDFDKSEKDALTKVLASYNIKASNEILKSYKEINIKWWKWLEEGKVEKSQIETGRFNEFWDYMKLKIDGEESGIRYLKHLSNTAYLIDGAIEVCREISERTKTAIVTNGIASVQYSRIAASGIDKYIKEVIVSEDVGFSKPDKRYFSAALERCGHSDTHDVLIIGDSLCADIKGGHDFGIDTCWYNPNDLVNTLGYEITYTIKSLNELLGIIE